MNVYVIGGGASGLMAAINASKVGCNVTILEKNKKIGEKLLITGNGRANVSNDALSHDKYYGDKKFISNVLCKYDVDDLKHDFAMMGAVLTAQNGYYYPNSFQASTIVEVLRDYAINLGVKIKTDNEVKSITKENDSFIIDCGYKYTADRVILTTGGCSYPNTGSTGDGYSFVKSLGHSIVEPTEALVPIACKTNLTKASGVRADVCITYEDYTELGQLQITNYGLSGIPIFNISRRVKTGDVITIDFAPNYPLDTLEKYFNSLSDKGFDYSKILLSLLNSKLVSVLADEFNKDTIKELVEFIKNYKVEVDSKLGFDRAQVTAGGVSTDEIDVNNMQSKIVKGLYLAGEIIDVDGICGGYNLHFAWASGYIAGRHTAD